MNEDIWIFGYGSLVWRPDFKFAERCPATVNGMVRRFWQGSTDHRGVPGKPGRVVTLEPKAGATCWGMAYKIVAANVKPIIAALNFREKGGYRLESVKLTLQMSEPLSVKGMVYIGTPENPDFIYERFFHGPRFTCYDFEAIWVYFLFIFLAYLA